MTRVVAPCSQNGLQVRVLPRSYSTEQMPMPARLHAIATCSCIHTHAQEMRQPGVEPGAQGCVPSQPAHAFTHTHTHTQEMHQPGMEPGAQACWLVCVVAPCSQNGLQVRVLPRSYSIEQMPACHRNLLTHSHTHTQEMRQPGIEPGAQGCMPSQPAHALTHTHTQEMHQPGHKHVGLCVAATLLALLQSNSQTASSCQPHLQVHVVRAWASSPTAA